MFIRSDCFLAVLFYVSVRPTNGILSYDVHEGMAVNMNCTVVYDVQTNQSYSVTWYQNVWPKPAVNELVANRTGFSSETFGKWKGHVKVLADGSLSVFSTVAVRDDALYTCQVVEAMGFNESVEIGLHVQLPVSPPNVGGLGNTVQLLHEGEKVTYDCGATNGYFGDAQPFVSWVNLMPSMIRHGFLNCTVFRYATVACNYSISFEVKAEMDGYQFRCRAIYYKKSLDTTYRIQVSYAPRVSITLYPGGTVNNGTNVMFSCNAAANPLPKFTWFGRRFPGGVAVYHNPVFTLMNATFNDAGEWRCEADNGYGQNESRVLLNVITVNPTQGPPPTTPPPSMKPPMQGYGVAGLVLAALCVAGLVAVIVVVGRQRRGGTRLMSSA